MTGTGAVGDVPAGAVAAFPFSIPLKEHGTMQPALASRGDSRTYLTHFLGSGLEDERYVVQRYRSRARAVYASRRSASLAYC